MASLLYLLLDVHMVTFQTRRKIQLSIEKSGLWIGKITTTSARGGLSENNIDITLRYTINVPEYMRLLPNVPRELSHKCSLSCLTARSLAY